MLRVVRVVSSAQSDNARLIDSVMLAPDQRRLQSAHLTGVNGTLIGLMLPEPVMLRMGDGITVLCEMAYAGTPLEHDRFPETSIFVEGDRGSPTFPGAQDHRQPRPTSGRIGRAFVADRIEIGDVQMLAADAHLGRSIRGAVPADACLGRGYLDECHFACSHMTAPARALEQAFDLGADHTERMFESSSVFFVALRSLRTLAEVESAAWPVGEKPGAGDCRVPEPLANDVD